MFHTTIQSGSDLRAIPTGELALRAYMSEHDDGLGHAAVLLADRRGARLINAIRDGLGQPGPLTTRLRCRLLDLRGLLFLEDAADWEDFEPVAQLEPDDPVVPEICLLIAAQSASSLERISRERNLYAAEAAHWHGARLSDLIARFRHVG